MRRQDPPAGPRDGADRLRLLGPEQTPELAPDEGAQPPSAHWAAVCALAQAALGADTCVWFQTGSAAVADDPAQPPGEAWRPIRFQGALRSGGSLAGLRLTREDLLFGPGAGLCADTRTCPGEWAQVLWQSGVGSAVTVVAAGSGIREAFCFGTAEPGTIGPDEQEVAAQLALLATTALVGGKLPLQTATGGSAGDQERSARLQALGAMAAGVAHGFSGVLASILGSVEMLARRVNGGDQCWSPEQRELVAAIESQALDGGDMVRRIREFARGPGGAAAEAGFLLRPEVVDLNDCARHVRQVTRPIWETEAEARGARIAFALELGDIPSVAASGAELREVIMNLVFNAIQALSADGTILVRTWTQGDQVFLSVTDDGVGMTPEVRQRALEPFFTTKGASGTGLGLSVAYGLITRHGGSLDLESTPGGGTTVTVRVPAAGQRLTMDAE